MKKTSSMPRPGKTDWSRLKAMKDEDIDFSDSPMLPSGFFKSGKTNRLPEPKKAISMRVDLDLLSWFKAQGRGYQTHMNKVLRAYASSHGMRAPKQAHR